MEIVFPFSQSRILAASAVAVPNTGNTNENTLATIAIPAGVMGLNGILRIWTQWDYPSTANNKTMRVKLGATSFSGVVATTTLVARILTMIHNRGVANSQIGGAANFAGIGTVGAGDVNGAIDTSVAQNLTITGQLALGTETLTLEAYLVELLVP